MLSDKEKGCAKLLFTAKRVERDNVRLSRDFPFGRWNLTYFMVRHFGPSTDRRELADLNQYLHVLNNMRWEMRNLPYGEARRIERIYILGRWVRLNDSFVDTIARGGKLEPLTKQIETNYQETMKRKGWLAFLRACIEVSWLASAFVFETKRARRLEKIRKLLRNGDYEESYQASMKVIGSMKYGYAKGVIEKAVIYVGASLLGVFAYETSTSFFVGVLLFIVTFAILPYYAFTKLFYE